MHIILHTFGRSVFRFTSAISIDLQSEPQFDLRISFVYVNAEEQLE